MQGNWLKKNFSQCHSTLYFWRQVPESKYPELKIPVYNSFLRIAKHIAVNFFPGNEVRKIKPSCSPGYEHLGKLIRTGLTNVVFRFLGTRKSKT